jgi:Rps23 Pro-64 3,4-dihydroxylase Tpa1-like proline 4-hydroxylase
MSAVHADHRQGGRDMEMDRSTMASEMAARLDEQHDVLVRDWQSSEPINYFVLDDLFPEKWARRIREAFPSSDRMQLKKSLRELKYVAAQMSDHDPLLEEAIYAFQMPEVVSRIERITALKSLEPDALLYAGGISMMGSGHFLNPHLDNSHDKFRQRYRVLNLLFYASPDWTESRGGNLELWPEGPTGKQTTVVSRFNRLVVMATNQRSGHSVSMNESNEQRCCVSNYYFSKYPIGDREYFQVTSFRGRPEQKVRDLILRADIWLRSAIRKVFPEGIKENPHFYDKDRTRRPE